MIPTEETTVQKAVKLSAEILEVTKALQLHRSPDKDEEDVTLYEAMVRMREPLVRALEKLNIDKNLRASDAYRPVIDNINRVAELESMNLAYFSQMQDTIKAAHKLVKQGQRIHKGYASASYEGMRVDMKQ